MSFNSVQGKLVCRSRIAGDRNGWTGTKQPRQPSGVNAKTSGTRTSRSPSTAGKVVVVVVVLHRLQLQLLRLNLHTFPETLQCHPLLFFESLRAHSPSLSAGRNLQHDLHHYRKPGKRLYYATSSAPVPVCCRAVRETKKRASKSSLHGKWSLLRNWSFASSLLWY